MSDTKYNIPLTPQEKSKCKRLIEEKIEESEFRDKVLLLLSPFYEFSIKAELTPLSLEKEANKTEILDVKKYFEEYKFEKGDFEKTENIDKCMFCLTHILKEYELKPIPLSDLKLTVLAYEIDAPQYYSEIYTHRELIGYCKEKKNC
jgi:hypothetical protein